jgi:glycosyltransferase involved in cell wall biosynthesis
MSNFSKTKIIQVNASSEVGGGPQVMWNIISGTYEYFNFEVIADDGFFIDKYLTSGVKVDLFGSRNIIAKIRKIRNSVKDLDVILHVHGTRVAIWARIAVIGMVKKPKIVYTLHGFHILRRFKKKFFIRWSLIMMERFLNRWTDILVCVSESDKKLVEKYKSILKGKIKIIKNGIDFSKFKVNSEEIKQEKEKLNTENNFVVSSISRLHPQKDILTLIRAFRVFLNQVDDADIKLLIIGDGPLRDGLKKEVKKLNLEKYVNFLGFREDTPLLINLSDLIVLSTNWEGLPLVPLETGASKKPIVASSVEGVKETIQNKKTGFLFEPGNAEDLAEKLLKLYNSKELREKLGQNAYNYVKQNFSRKKMIEEYKKLYNSLT